jgi:hypothetical protein
VGEQTMKRLILLALASATMLLSCHNSASSKELNADHYRSVLSTEEIELLVEAEYADFVHQRANELDYRLRTCDELRNKFADDALNDAVKAIRKCKWSVTEELLATSFIMRWREAYPNVKKVK